MCNKLISSYIPIAISFASLIISIFVLIRDSWKERFNIKCEKVKWFASTIDNRPFFIWLIISNHSKLPISVLGMELTCVRNGETHHAISRGEKHIVMTHKHDEGHKTIYSNDYPICINGYSSFGGYIHFISSAPHYYYEDQDVEITIKTNRGTKKERFHLDFGSNIYRVLQQLSGELPVLNDQDGIPIDYQYDGV